jgi:hypothetical protein
MPSPVVTAGTGWGLGRGPERGRQVASALSPDSSRKASSRDRNLYVSDTSGRNELWARAPPTTASTKAP